jgi:hypothetical protein
LILLKKQFHHQPTDEILSFAYVVFASKNKLETRTLPKPANVTKDSAPGIPFSVIIHLGSLLISVVLKIFFSNTKQCSVFLFQ